MHPQCCSAQVAPAKFGRSMTNWATKGAKLPLKFRFTHKFRHGDSEPAAQGADNELYLERPSSRLTSEGLGCICDRLGI